MALYECVFIARQDIGSSQAQALIEEFVKIIEDNGGSVPKQEYWGLKTLSYRIKKNRKGHYVLLNIDAPHAAIAELERQLGLHEDILRTLVVRVEEHEEGPSAMMQSRGRDDRGGRRGGRDDRGPRDRGPRDRGPRDEEKPAVEAETKSEQPQAEASEETKSEGEAA